MYQLATFLFLFFANTYLNSLLIPDSLKWKDGKLRTDFTGLAVIQTIILLVEVIVLMWLMYQINKRVLSNSIAWWTAGIYLTLSVICIAIIIYGSFR
jgi:heme/copper-type cytochrome/quinol oxidase subunit 3